MADSYKALSELYAKRKEEQAKALGALESYNQQKKRAQTEFLNSLEHLSQIVGILSDVELANRVAETIARGKALDFSPESIKVFARELDSVINDLETEIKEKLA